MEIGSEGYPPDLETLVKGVALAAPVQSAKTSDFCAEIPVDPMTGRAEWGLRAVQDDPDSTSWGGKNVFDVYSKSTGTCDGWNKVFRLVESELGSSVLSERSQSDRPASCRVLHARQVEAGFTIIELMVVMLIISILIGIAAISLRQDGRRARESALKQDLQTMRQSIDNYTLDKQQAPQSSMILWMRTISA